MTGVGVVTLGEALALFAQSAPGVVRSGAPFELRVGGAELNVAIGLARLGVPATWIGRIGADPFGEEILRALRAEGVQVIASADPTRPTGLMVKDRRTALHQRISYYRAGSAGSALAPSDFTQADITHAALLHTTGISLAISASAASAVEHAISLARAAGTTVSFDVNHRPRLWSAAEAADRIRKLLPLVDVLFAGADEAALVLGEDCTPPDLARRLAELGPTTVVIKLGSGGAIAIDQGHSASAPAHDVPVIDTVGAGDAFVAGYLAALLDGQPLPDRLQMACAAGGFACTSPGDWEGAPSRTELALLQSAEPVQR